MPNIFQPTYERAYTADPTHPGAMIAFLLDDATIAALQAACAPLDVTPDHVTLVYLAPDASALDAHKSALIRAIANVACCNPPIEGTVNGFGRFQAAEGDDTSALYASIDCPALPALRQNLWDMACMSGCRPVAEHGFVPHATLAYLPIETATPSLDLPAIPLRFAAFALVWGGEQISFPFSEEPFMADDYRAITETDVQSHYSRALCDRAVAKEQKAGTPIRFIAGSEGAKRDGLDLKMAGARLDAFRNNPVVLWGHDYAGARLPIGRAQPTIDGPRLIADISFDQEDEFARQIESKYRRGFLNTVSLGWKINKINGRNVTDWELLDISAVPVPGDADALMQRQLRALQADVSDLPAWPEVAADMAALILFPTNRAGKAWRLEYHRLSRLYDQLGKEPPERLAPDYLAALDNEAVSGLFLEDERDIAPDLFTKRAAEAAPRPLTAADRADLACVVERLQEVLARAAEPPTTEADQPPAEPAPDDATADPALLSLASILGVR
jgi:2'-5' RNA ligase